MHGDAATLAAHGAAMFALGLVAATIGSLAGLGGGFMVAPALRLFFHRAPAEAAAASLVLVLANVSSASLAFWRQGRVDVRLAATIGLLAIPGSIVGALLVRFASAAWFDVPYALLLAAFAAALLWRPARHARARPARLPWSRPRVFFDRTSGEEFRYDESPPVAAGAGLATGFISSFFGIGGGVLVVPLLLRLFALPPHIASATSHMVILFSAPFGVATHALQGQIYWLDAGPLVAGGLLGGQLGAATSRRLSATALVRIVGGVMLLAAAALVAGHLDGSPQGRR